MSSVHRVERILLAFVAIVLLAIGSMVAQHQYLARHPTCRSTGWQGTYLCQFDAACGWRTADEASEVLQDRGWTTYTQVGLLHGFLAARPQEKEHGIVAFEESGSCGGGPVAWAFPREGREPSFIEADPRHAFPSCYRYLVRRPQLQTSR